MNFKKDNYLIIKNVISKEIANICYEYLLLKRKVGTFLINNKYVSEFDDSFGKLGDEQVKGTYASYSDILMETLLIKIQPIMEKLTKLKLVPTYSYTRIYKKGDILHRHIDRASCEISTTLNLGGDSWPIYLDPTGETSILSGGLSDIKLKKNANKGIEVNLTPGDMLVYKGHLLEHWRNEFKGDNCCQVFLHYNNSSSKFAKEHIYDTRPFIGLPDYLKGVKI